MKIQRCYVLSHCASFDTKAKVGRTAGAWLSTAAPDCISSLYSLPLCTLSRKKNSVSLNNFLGEVVKSIAFINSQSLSPCLTLLCDKMGGPHKAFLVHVKVQWYLQESTCVIVGNGQWWALLHVKHLFTWKNTGQTKYGYSYTNIWQTFSQKWTRWHCHFKENNW